MKKFIVFILIGLILSSLLLSSCSETELVTSTPANEQEESKTRIITDLTGAQVEIPRASEIKKVIVVSPPLVATYASVVKDTSMIAGMHPMSINNANAEILDLIVPNWKDINTTFLTGFTSNAEEVIKMNPDIILVYGDSQKEGLENVDIPVVNFFIKNMVNESWSVKIDQLMRDIFEIDDSSSLEKEWADANDVANEVLSKVGEGDKKTAIMISSNTGDKITVRAATSYGDDWLLKTGLVNAASDIDGDGIEVSMEQMLVWNPDIIYCFRGIDASEYLNNSIDGQDWSQINAFKNGAIYDMPCGMFNWGAPNVDSPLTLIWMAMKNYPGTIEESFFNDYMKEYYQRQYGIILTDELQASILDPAR